MLNLFLAFLLFGAAIIGGTAIMGGAIIYFISKVISLSSEPTPAPVSSEPTPMILKNFMITMKEFLSISVEFIDSKNIVFGAMEGFQRDKISKIYYKFIIDMILEGEEWNNCSEEEKEKLEKMRIYFFDYNNVKVTEYTFYASFNSSKNILILYDVNGARLF